MKRIYVLIAALLIVAGGIGYAAGSEWGDHDWRDNEKVQVVNANGQDTIVVRDHDRGFFPGFLFIPLFFLLVFGLSRAFFWRGRGGGPWNDGSDRFDEWHRRAHANDSTSKDTPNAPPAF